VVVCDPEGKKEGEALLPGVEWVDDAYAAAAEADALVVITEWNQFRGLDLTRLSQSMRGKVLVDLRNIYSVEDATAAGFAYTDVGRTPLAVA
jgi:UDPglucose 6-dehydrogenase